VDSRRKKFGFLKKILRKFQIPLAKKTVMIYNKTITVVRNGGKCFEVLRKSREKHKKHRFRGRVASEKQNTTY
jgi:hypothetical protein